MNFKPVLLVSALCVFQACTTSEPTDNVTKSLPKKDVATTSIFFNTPAVVDIDPTAKNANKSRGKNFMGQALPLGNGRLGAMFSGGVEREYIVFNEITLWMHTNRGLDEVRQSSTRINGRAHLESVRKAARDEKFAKGDDSVESLGTKYLAGQEPVGNYAPFADIEVSTGQNMQAAKNYRRELDIYTGLGTVSYTLDDVQYRREFFL